MTITYRDATPADAPALDQLFRRVFSETFGHLYRAEDLDSFLASFTVADWERQLGDTAFACHVAEVGSALAGYAKLGALKLPVADDGGALLLDQLYVFKPYQGAGIAHALMDWTIEEARRRGATRLYLTVFIDNHRARRFYERYRFRAVGRYDFMVGSHADEDIIMRADL